MAENQTIETPETAGEKIGDIHSKKKKKLSAGVYEKELAKLHLELVKMQYWIRKEGKRVVLIFEGRDAAGKGSTIKRVVEPLNPRGCRVVALGRRPTASGPNGTFSGMSPTCPQRERWWYLIAAGTTDPASSG